MCRTGGPAGSWADDDHNTTGNDAGPAGQIGVRLGGSAAANKATSVEVSAAASGTEHPDLVALHKTINHPLGGER